MEDGTLRAVLGSKPVSTMEFTGSFRSPTRGCARNSRRTHGVTSKKGAEKEGLFVSSDIENIKIDEIRGIDGQCYDLMISIN